MIEVLHTVYGLGPRDLRRTVDVEVGGMAARTLLPHIILKAKLANSATMPQDATAAASAISFRFQSQRSADFNPHPRMESEKPSALRLSPYASSLASWACPS